MKIGVLHPGEMGVSLCAALSESGHEVLWCSGGRGPETLDRAKTYSATLTIEELCEKADGIISVCPPHAAGSQAGVVANTGFDGIYVDANAISPRSAEAIAETIGSNFVDGGIIGPPALKPGTTRLYVSGARSREVTSWFSRGPLEVCTLTDDSIGDTHKLANATDTRASALKMAYAAYTKGNSALLLAVSALAEAGSVREDLQREWEISQQGLVERSRGAAKGTSRKAWRFVGEMEEIAATFEHFGMTGAFHEAAGDIYERMSDLKDLPPSDLEVVLERILARKKI
ncbi:MAG: DUF1932 domain-containing protein [Pseudomonadales bacterium]|nr:DUF1932 domain-containing protein [Pseudomonadales bacterium]